MLYTANVSEPASGAVIGGKYQALRRLGAGAVGTVWVAREVGSGRNVAIKVLSPETLSSPIARARFEREVAAAARLRSRHVIEVYDHGVFNGSPFIAMELLEGEDLLARLKREKRLSLADAARIAEQIAVGLGPAHDAGIIHRDLKPANVFLVRRGDDEIVKIIDFGIARFINAGDGPGGAATETGTVLGSPHYMSPEQAAARKDLDHRVDLWALGAIVYRMITGQLPFPGRDIAEIIVAIVSEEAPPPSAVAPEAGFGPEVDRFFAKALARDPNARFQSARELSSAFSALPNPAPVMASPEQVTAVMAPSRAVATAAPAITAPAPIAAPAPIVRANVPSAPASSHGYYAAPHAPARTPKPTSAGAWVIAGVGAVVLVALVVAIVLALAFMWSQ